MLQRIACCVSFSLPSLHLRDDSAGPIGFINRLNTTCAVHTHTHAHILSLSHTHFTSSSAFRVLQDEQVFPGLMGFQDHQGRC